MKIGYAFSQGDVDDEEYGCEKSWPQMYATSDLGFTIADNSRP